MINACARPSREVLGRGDDKDLPDAREHQRAHGIIHHRLVVDGQELLAHSLCDGVQPRAGASG